MSRVVWQFKRLDGAVAAAAMEGQELNWETRPHDCTGLAAWGLGHDGLAILMPERGASAALLATPHNRPVVRATERMWERTQMVGSY